MPPASNIYPFVTDDDVIAFAKVFIAVRIKGFTKDIRICLTPNKDDVQAYFPALITCIGFIDLLSGLYCGKLDGHGHRDFLKFTERFFPTARYTADELSILYQGMRHKVAHLSHPFAVFDTGKKSHVFPGKRRLIAWTVHGSRKKRPITLTQYAPPRYFQRTKAPWPVAYDERVEISVRCLVTDALRAARGPNSYLSALATDATLRSKFRACMAEYYPR